MIAGVCLIVSFTSMHSIAAQPFEGEYENAALRDYKCEEGTGSLNCAQTWREAANWCLTMECPGIQRKHVDRPGEHKLCFEACRTSRAVKAPEGGSQYSKGISYHFLGRQAIAGLGENFVTSTTQPTVMVIGVINNGQVQAGTPVTSNQYTPVDSNGCSCSWIPSDNCQSHDSCAASCRDANPWGPCSQRNVVMPFRQAWATSNQYSPSKKAHLHPMSLNLIIMAAAAGGISIMLAVMRHNHNSQRAHLLLTDAEATEDA